MITVQTTRRYASEIDYVMAYNDYYQRLVSEDEASSGEIVGMKVLSEDYIHYDQALHALSTRYIKVVYEFSYFHA